jgi:hypothetical protein
MSNQIDIPNVERIAKLIRLLGSDQDGEIVATVKALQRTLKNDGLDLHALATSLTGTKTANPKDLNHAYRDGFRDGYDRARFDDEHEETYDDKPTWYQVAKFCAARSSLLRRRSRDFVNNMVMTTKRGHVPTEKQAIWLHDLYVQLGGQ